MRIFAVDPGVKRLGIALSDPTGTLAAPLTVLRHISKSEDARRIAELAEEHGCGLILVGAALHWDGGETDSSRQARNLAKAIREHTQTPVELWDESGSTQAARRIGREWGAGRKKRRRHLDDAAAAVILQSYLDHPKRKDD